MHTVIFRGAANQEALDAYYWYEEQKIGLGDEFFEEIEICTEHLKRHPDRFSFINAQFRRIKTERFPYTLIYGIEDDIVVIYSVRHIKRKPL